MERRAGRGETAGSGGHGVDLRDLAARAKRREADAFALMFDLFFERLRRYAFYRLGDLDRSEDLAADVIRLAIENIERFDDRGGSLDAWLYGIARNLVARQFKEARVKPLVSIEDAPVLSGGERPDERVMRDLSYLELYDAISRLTDEQREVVVLRYIEGLNSKTVAAIVGKNSGAVRGIQHRALQALRKSIGQADQVSGAGGPADDTVGLGASGVE